MLKKLLIFGGGGFVGGNMTLIAQQKGWRTAIVDNLYRPRLKNVEWQTIDITDAHAVDKVIADIKPDGVVNLAAIADIDKAEQEKEFAWKVNVAGAKYIAKSCAERGTKYVFISSDAVFDGKSSSYSEEDSPNPVNYYGQTKLEAEKAVLAEHPRAVIVRVSLVIGFPVTGGNSFLTGLVGKIREGKEVLCPTDEIRTPVDVLTLSECVLELLESDFSGVLHIGATNSINRYELTKKIVKLMGFDSNCVKQQALPEQNSNRAPRHKNGIISVAKAEKILKTRLLSVDDGINRAFNERI